MPSKFHQYTCIYGVYFLFLSSTEKSLVKRNFFFQQNLCLSSLIYKIWHQLYLIDLMRRTMYRQSTSDQVRLTYLHAGRVNCLVSRGRPLRLYLLCRVEYIARRLYQNLFLKKIKLTMCSTWFGRSGEGRSNLRPPCSTKKWLPPFLSRTSN